MLKIYSALFFSILISAFFAPPTLAESIKANLLTSPDAYYQANIDFWEKHLKRDPFSGSAVKNLVGAELSLARYTGNETLYTDAESRLKKAKDFMPKNDASYAVLLSKTIMARHSFSEAKRILEDSLKNNADSAPLKSALGDALQGLGDYEAAITIFEKLKAVETKKENFHLDVRLALLYDVIGKDNLSIELLNQAAKYKIEDPEALAWVKLMQGVFYLKRKDFTKAAEFFNSSLASSSNYYLAQEHLAEVHESQKEYATALPLLEAAVKTKRSAELLIRLARVKQELGDREQAEILKKEAQAQLEALVKNNAYAHGRELASYLLDQNIDLNRALKILETEHSARPGDILSNYQRARALRMLGRIEEAKIYISKALRFPNTNEDEIHEEYKKIYNPEVI